MVCLTRRVWRAADVARVEQLDLDLQDVVRALGWPDSLLEAGRSPPHATPHPPPSPPPHPSSSATTYPLRRRDTAPSRSCGRGKSCSGKWERCDDACHAAMRTALGGTSLEDVGSTAALATELYHCFDGKPRDPALDLVKLVEELYPEDVLGYEPPRREDARTCSSAT